MNLCPITEVTECKNSANWSLFTFSTWWLNTRQNWAANKLETGLPWFNTSAGNMSASHSEGRGEMWTWNQHEQDITTSNSKYTITTNSGKHIKHRYFSYAMQAYTLTNKHHSNVTVTQTHVYHRKCSNISVLVHHTQQTSLQCNEVTEPRKDEQHIGTHMYMYASKCIYCTKLIIQQIMASWKQASNRSIDRTSTHTHTTFKAI